MAGFHYPTPIEFEENQVAPDGDAAHKQTRKSSRLSRSRTPPRRSRSDSVHKQTHRHSNGMVHSPKRNMGPKTKSGRQLPQPVGPTTTGHQTPGRSKSNQLEYSLSHLYQHDARSETPEAGLPSASSKKERKPTSYRKPLSRLSPKSASGKPKLLKLLTPKRSPKKITSRSGFDKISAALETRKDEVSPSNDRKRSSRTARSKKKSSRRSSDIYSEDDGKQKSFKALLAQKQALAHTQSSNLEEMTMLSPTARGRQDFLLSEEAASRRSPSLSPERALQTPKSSGMLGSFLDSVGQLVTDFLDDEEAESDHESLSKLDYTLDRTLSRYG